MTSENSTRVKLIKSHDDDTAVGDSRVLYANSGKTSDNIREILP